VVGPMPGAPMVDVKVRVWAPETVVMVVKPVAGPPGFPVWLPPDARQVPSG
jgi:hypothetical protein